MRGFDRPEDAQRVANAIWSVICTVSTHINAERLAGVTIAGDYVEALADVDRGFDNLSPLVRSDNDTMTDVAMSVPVVRDGVLKKHLVFDAEYVLPIVMCEPDSEEYRRAIYMVAHEVAQIADLRDLDTAFPDTLLKVRLSGMPAWIEPHAASLWSEYTACRQSAKFGREQGEMMIEVATKAVEDGQNDASDAIADYRFHASIDQLLTETLEPGSRAVRACAYVVGHLDAFDEEMPDELRDALAEGELLELVEEMRVGLRRLWDRRGKWASRAEFDFMAQVIRDSMAIAGLIITDHPNDPAGGARIDVPFTTKNPWRATARIR